MVDGAFYAQKCYYWVRDQEKIKSNELVVTVVIDVLGIYDTKVVYPTEEDRQQRLQIINDLKDVVGKLEIFKGATVEPFVSNLFTRWGDLDISINLANGLYISFVCEECKKTLLKKVCEALNRGGRFQGVECILNARVPILKCESNMGNISCDISINNLIGQMKSKLLSSINEIDGRFRDMVLIAKEWTKAQGINDPKTGTLNSYSLSLLIVFHFQTCEPAIFPPLNEIYPGDMVADLTGVRAVNEKHIEEICSGNIERIKSDSSRPINKSSLAELFISFLEKFCDISLKAEKQGISPHNGQWEDIDVQAKKYPLFIEDPFEQPVNSARTVGKQKLKDIASAFQSSYQKLTSPDQHHLLSVLVRRVSSIMPRSQAANSGIHDMNVLRIHRLAETLLVFQGPISQTGQVQTRWRPRGQEAKNREMCKVVLYPLRR